MDHNKFYCFNGLATSFSNEFIHVDKKKRPASPIKT